MFSSPLSQVHDIKPQYNQPTIMKNLNWGHMVELPNNSDLSNLSTLYQTTYIIKNGPNSKQLQMTK